MHILIALYFVVHVVKPGDTLWGMVGNHYPVVCRENHIRNCDLIYPGQKIRYPNEWRANVRTTASVRANDNDETRNYTSAGSRLSGTLGCAGLEQLWNDNGGNPANAFTAAEIAMAESSGQQYATGPVGEEGYWQINPVNGDATYNPDGNARAAIYLSRNGQDWSPWTTYTSGRYLGRCLLVTLEERVRRIELILAQWQSQLGYVGLCVNASLHPNVVDHPHWEGEELEEIKKNGLSSRSRSATGKSAR